MSLFSIKFIGSNYLVLHVSATFLCMRSCHGWVGQKRPFALPNFRSKSDSEHIGLEMSRQAAAVTKICQVQIQDEIIKVKGVPQNDYFRIK